jgi:hypothetical protein
MEDRSSWIYHIPTEQGIFRMTSTLFDVKATTAKRQRLEQLETIIKDGYYRQGEAFKEIRDTRLYLLDYESFDAYCKAEWGHNRAWADRLTAAAKLAGDIKQIDPNGSIPKNESQARALKKLTPEVQKSVLAELAETNSNVTAKSVQKAAEQYKKPVAKNIQADPISREDLAWFLQEQSMDLADCQKKQAYVKACLEDMWFKLDNVPENLEVSKIKLQLEILFYRNEIIGNQIKLEEINLNATPWGFSVR